MSGGEGALRSIFKEPQNKNKYSVHGANTEKNSKRSVIDNMAVLKKLKESFETEYAEYIAVVPSFCQLVKGFMERRRWNSIVFKEKTLLGDAMYSRIVNNDIRSPSFHTVMTICVGLGLNVKMAEQLLNTAGYAFGVTEEFQVYHFILTSMNGYSIDECNTFLEHMGMEPLGSRHRAPRKAEIT